MYLLLISVYETPDCVYFYSGLCKFYFEDKYSILLKYYFQLSPLEIFFYLIIAWEIDRGTVELKVRDHLVNSVYDKRRQQRTNRTLK